MLDSKGLLLRIIRQNEMITVKLKPLKICSFRHASWLGFESLRFPPKLEFSIRKRYRIDKLANTPLCNVFFLQHFWRFILTTNPPLAEALGKPPLEKPPLSHRKHLLRLVYHSTYLKGFPKWWDYWICLVMVRGGRERMKTGMKPRTRRRIRGLKQQTCNPTPIAFIVLSFRDSVSLTY